MVRLEARRAARAAVAVEYFAVAVAVCGMLLAVGCSDSNKASESDAATSAADAQSGADAQVSADASVQPDGSGGADASPPAACVPLGAECQSSGQCCGGGACEAGADGRRRCVTETACAGVGQPCDRASSCCSLGCGADGVCVDPSGGGGAPVVCTPSGEDAEANGCSADKDCCSDNCDEASKLCTRNAAGSCETLGEACDTAGVDAACCSRTCVNVGAAETPDLRCGRASACGARGEICAKASDCCAGVCQDDGRCPTQNELGGTLFSGEPCEKDENCATRACAPSYPGGPKFCQFLGGCRPAGDGSTGSSLCTEDWQCCGYYELSPGADACLDGAELAPGAACVPHPNVDGLKVCALQTNAKEVGEICKFVDDQDGDGELDPGELQDLHDCCCAAGVDCCVPSSSGVYRCRGGAYDPDSCRGDKEACEVPEQCCSGICAPKAGGGGFACSGSCVADGQACSRSADCCSFSCVDGVCGESAPPPVDGGTTGPDAGAGADAGSADAGAPPPPQCRPLGSSCTAHTDCCTEYCSSLTNSCTTLLH